MLCSRLPLVLAAILCCAVNAKPSAAPARTSQVLLNGSSISTSLQQQIVSASSTTSLSSSFSKLSDSSSGSSILISSPVTISSPTSTTTPTSSCGTCVWDHIAPPPIPGSNTPQMQISTSDAGSVAYKSSPTSSTAVHSSGSDIENKNSPSTTLATTTAITPSDKSSRPVPLGVPLKSGGPAIISSPASAPTAVGPNTLASASTGPNVPTPPSTSDSTAPNSDFPELPPPVTSLDPLQLNTSSTTPYSPENLDTYLTRTHSSAYYNVTTTLYIPSSYLKSTRRPNTSYQYQNTSSTCTPYTQGETITIWSIVPNTNTITITMTANQSNTYTTTPEFTPPVPACTPKPKKSWSSVSTSSSSSILPFAPIPPRPITTGLVTSIIGEPQSEPIGPHFSTRPAASSEPESTTLPVVPPPITTAIITSKNPVTLFTTVAPPQFPGGGKTEKQSAQGNPSSEVTGPGSGGSGSGSGSGLHLTASPNTINVGGVTVVVGPNSVAIGGQTVAQLPPGSTSLVTQGGQTFTVNPSEVIGPGTVIAIPTTSGGGVFMESPSPTVVDGVSISVGNGVAVVGGSTYAIGAGAPEQTVVVNNENISIGPGGVGIADVTITPPAPLPTNVVLFDGQVFSAVGASVAVFDTSSVTFTGGTPETIVFNGDTITIGPEGVIDGTSTLGGPSHPTGTQLGIAGGILVTEIGSTIAVIDGTTLTVGPDATQTTATIDGKTITATTSGLIIDGSTTLKFPFNPTTQEITSGGITFSEIGSSLVVIGGTTFTIGPGAVPTTDLYNGQTISLGPGGIGFATTTVTSLTNSPTAASTSGKKKKNMGAALGPPFGILGNCIALGVGLLI